MLVAVGLLGIGSVLVLPIFVRLVAGIMVRSGRHATLLIAGRRLQAQPAAVNRVVSGLLLGLFLVVGGRAVIVDFEGTSQFVGAAQQLFEQQRVNDSVPAADIDDTIAQITTVAGVRQVIAYPILTTTCSASDDLCLTAMVATCGQLATVDPTATGCRDGEVMMLGVPPVDSAVSEIAWLPTQRRAPDPVRVATTPSPQTVVDVSPFNPPAAVIIPPSLPGIAGVAGTSDHIVVVLGDPGRDLAQRLHDAGALPDAYSIWDMAEYDFIVMLRTAVYAVAAVVMGVGLLAFAIAAIDRAVLRRRELTSLRLVGISASTLRRTQWIEALVPITAGASLAIALGHFAGNTYLAFGSGELTAPWRPTLILAAVAALGGAVIAALTVIATNQPITSDTIRAE